MASAAALQIQIESLLESRFPAALSPVSRTVRDVASTGIKKIDALLDGGLPAGAISEIIGPASSGRTSLALSFVAQRTAEDRVCAWVDVHDALDPASAAANGVVLPQLLWIRCNENQPQHEHGRKSGQNRVWTRLDQALRATDLLLQAGGFAAVILDLGSTAPEHARRIPLATWFRFRLAADRTRASVIVLAQTSCAQSSATLALECEALRAEAQGTTVLRGFSASVQRRRERFSAAIELGAKKPPASTWSAEAQWKMEKPA